MAETKKTLKFAFVSDTAEALKSLVGLERQVQATGRTAEETEGQMTGATGGMEVSAKDAAAAMRRLGLTMEEDAKKRVEDLEKQVATIEAAERQGLATMGDVERARERLGQQQERWARLTARTTTEALETPLERLERRMKSLQDRLNRFSSGFRGLAKGAGMAIGSALLGQGGAAAVGFQEVRGAADRADRLRKLARTTNTDVETLSALEFAAEQSGVQVAVLATSFNGLRKSMDLALDPKKGKESILSKLGISVLDAEGNVRKFDDVLIDVVDKLSQIENEGSRAIAAAEVFGAKAGPQLASFLTLGREGIESYIDTAQRFGLVVTAEAGEAAERFNDRLDDLSRRFTGLKAQAAEPFFDPFAAAFVRVGEVIDANKDKILALATALAGGMLVLLEDFIALAEGRNADVENQWLIQLVEAAKTFGALLIDVVIPSLQAMLALFESLGPTGGKVLLGLLAFGSLIGPIVSGLMIVIGPAVITAIGGIIGAIVAGVPVIVAGLVASVGLLPVALTAALIATVWIFRDEITSVFTYIFEKIGSMLSAITGGVGKAWRYVTGRSEEEPTPGFSRGGYTGDDAVDEVAGVVHGKEFVFSAAATARYGVDMLSDMNDLITPPSFGTIPAEMAEAGSPARGAPVSFDAMLGGQAFPMTTDGDVYDQLSRAVSKRQATQTSSAPGFARKNK
ncbi:MAG: hypothetical protein MEQ74_05160 [Paracoccus sp.]|nr:hypothetical protein [Paracoccus sp. (in: a-proteobacteria)]